MIVFSFTRFNKLLISKRPNLCQERRCQKSGKEPSQKDWMRKVKEHILRNNKWFSEAQRVAYKTYEFIYGNAFFYYFF